jgi:hypothetical protein
MWMSFCKKILNLFPTNFSSLSSSSPSFTRTKSAGRLLRLSLARPRPLPSRATSSSLSNPTLMSHPQRVAPPSVNPNHTEKIVLLRLLLRRRLGALPLQHRLATAPFRRPSARVAAPPPATVEPLRQAPRSRMPRRLLPRNENSRGWWRRTEDSAAPLRRRAGARAGHRRAGARAGRRH